MSHKSLDYYKNLEYSIIVEKQEADDESWFIAYSSELGKIACYGRGYTRAEAIDSFLEEKDAFIEYLFDEGKSIPEPCKLEYEKYSGFFNVRTSPIIHANLVHQARELGVSLNLYLNQLLSAAIERNNLNNNVLSKLTELCNQLEDHHTTVTSHLQYRRGPLARKLEQGTEYSKEFLESA